MGVSGCICDKYESCRQNRRVFDLENRLAEVEAERDARFPGAPILSAEYMAMQDRALAAEARLAKVEALHYQRGGVCFHCYDTQGGSEANWPCPTTVAARGEGDGG